VTAQSVTPEPARFPGFAALGQAGHWDAATRAVVLARLEPPGPTRFFSRSEQATATALVAQLVDVEPGLAASLVSGIDARLADDQTDGWHYDDMPTDEEAWRRSLAALDAEAVDPGSGGFAGLEAGRARAVLEDIAGSDAAAWHGLPRKRVWDLWMRYAATAYYAHPAAWDEMGWPGPAYPRGYKNAGIDAREPFEVRDTPPAVDPARRPA
jgi:Gluconate 2-dehydrogenase subunit 3